MIDESTIRERAYVLWEKDACPEGAAEFYWHLAREQLEALVRPKEACVGGANFLGRNSALHPITVPLESKMCKDPIYAKAVIS